MGESIFSKFFNLFKKTKNNDSSGMESTSERYGISTVKDNPLYDQESVGERYGTDEGATYINPIFDVVAEQELKKQEVPEKELPKQELPENELPKQELAETATQTETETETETDPTSETQSVNRLKNIGGMPTRDSIKKMLDVQSLGKLEKHKHFDKALAALALYQDIMQREQKVVLTDEAARRRKAKYVNAYAEVELAGKCDAAVDEAWLAMAEFVYEADLAVKGANGFFARRSSTVRKLAPVFANLLMQAYSLLPKLSHLESAIPPYLIAMKKTDEAYTLDEVLNHGVSGGRSGGLATRGPEENSAIILSPKEALNVVKSTRKESQSKSAKAMNDKEEEEIQEAEEAIQKAEEEKKKSEIRVNEVREKSKGSGVDQEEEIAAWNSLQNNNRAYLEAVNARNELIRAKRGSGLEGMRQLRAEKTEAARMALTIPPIIGVLKKQYKNAVSAEQRQLTEQRADEIATAYIAELRLRMTALQDVAESYEFSGKTERAGVHDKQAEYFRLSRLLYRLISNKDLLKKAILLFDADDLKKIDTKYQDIKDLGIVQGKTLSAAVDEMNSAAKNNYVRLVDANGKALQEDTKEEKKDYFVAGGQTSISIIDRVNQRVLRAPQERNEYLSKAEQEHALNGIRDEAAGKVSQFLGFNVCAQAEAKGFMARKKGSDKETPVFGGSVMDMAKGTDAENINLMMKAGDDSKVNKNNKTSLEIMKQGRLIGDFMKLNVLDYIIQHDDRNAKNFLINLEAGENESMVTAIDNDMILGSDQNRAVGGKSSAQALYGVNNQMFMDFGFKLETAFPMMTQEVKDTLERLDLQALSDLLMPYADRVVRLVAVHRAAELKEWAKKVPTCDLTTEEGVREYVKIVMERSMTEWVRSMVVDRQEDQQMDGSGVRFLPSMLVKWVLEHSYGLTGKFVTSCDADKIVKMMNIAGLSREQAKKILLENLSYSNTGDVAITEAEFKKSLIGKEFEKYKWDESYVL